MSSNKQHTSKTAVLARVQALIAGTQKHYPNGSFTLGSTTYTTASLVQLLQGLVDAMSATNVAHNGLKDAVATAQGIEAKVSPVLQAYKRFLLAAFSNATQTLADFGLQPPRARAPLTGEQQAAAAAKAKATRAARGTTSKKQKLAVKGHVTGITVTPITSAVPATSAPQPVSNTPSTPAPGAATK